MINFQITKYDLEISKNLKEIFKLLVDQNNSDQPFKLKNHFDIPKTHYPPGVEPIDTFTYEPNKLRSTLAEYKRSDDWKNNLQIIQTWLIKRFELSEKLDKKIILPNDNNEEFTQDKEDSIDTDIATEEILEQTGLPPEGSAFPKDYKDVNDYIEVEDYHDIFILFSSKEFQSQIPSFNKRVNYSFDLNDFALEKLSDIWIKYIFVNQKKLIDKNLSKIIALIDDIEFKGELLEIDERYMEHYSDPIFPDLKSVTYYLAEMEFEHKLIEHFKDTFFKIKNSLLLFNHNFLNIGEGYHSDDSPTPSIYSISLQHMLAYKNLLFIITGQLSTIDLSNTKMNDSLLIYEYDQPYLVRNIFALIHLRLIFLEDYFDNALEQFKSSKSFYASYIQNEEKLLKYLSDYYQDISTTNNYRFIVLEGIQLPKEIENSFCKCLNQLLLKKIAMLNGSILDKMVSLKTLMEKGITIKGDDQSNVENEIPIELDRTFFDKNKITWGREEKHTTLLKKIFEPLHTQKNKGGKYFMAKKDVNDLIKRNFNIDDSHFQPKFFEFKGELVTLRYFIFQIYEFINNHDVFSITKKRWIQFMLQNFDILSKDLKEINSSKKYKTFQSNQRKSEPRRNPTILINQKDLLKLINL